MALGGVPLDFPWHEPCFHLAASGVVGWQRSYHHDGCSLSIEDQLHPDTQNVGPVEVVGLPNNNSCKYRVKELHLTLINLYLDLQTGAKWFLKGVNSPSLRVELAPL